MELKACPFCGREAINIKDRWAGCKEEHGVWCHIEDWNTRPIEDALFKKIKELQQTCLDDKNAYVVLQGYRDALSDQLADLNRKLEIAQNGLRFYATPANWDFLDGFPIFLQRVDHGYDIAEKTLKEITKETE